VPGAYGVHIVLEIVVDPATIFPRESRLPSIVPVSKVVADACVSEVESARSVAVPSRNAATVVGPIKIGAVGDSGLGIQEIGHGRGE
jgi:hypothetical protein